MNMFKDLWLLVILAIFAVIVIVWNIPPRAETPQSPEEVQGDYVLIVQKEPVVNGEYDTHAYGPVQFDFCDSLAKAIYEEHIPGYAALVCTSVEAFNNSSLVTERHMQIEGIHVFELELEELNLKKENTSKGMFIFLYKLPFLIPFYSPMEYDMPKDINLNKLEINPDSIVRDFLINKIRWSEEYTYA